MAVTKHTLGESGEDLELWPPKKNRLDNREATGSASRDKRDKKEKKKSRKEKQKIEHRLKSDDLGDGELTDAIAPIQTDDANDDARCRAKKSSKKARNQAKELKRQEAQLLAGPDGEVHEAFSGVDYATLKQTKSSTAAGKTEKLQPAGEKPKDKIGKKKQGNGTEQETKQKVSAEDYSPATEMKYAQTISLSSVPQADIDAFLATHHITVVNPRTHDLPLRPVIEFDHLPATNLLERRPSPFAGFASPTPIQAASWPYTLSGRDAVGVAETGSGKTMAFALPCVEAVLAAVSAAKSENSTSINKAKKTTKNAPATTTTDTITRAVIVSPTRELAMQIHEQLARMAALVGLRCVCVYGGVSKDAQRALVQRGGDIIVATPGRLKDFMAENTIRLDAARFVVLDEADRMLDKGFEDDIQLILSSCPARDQCQTLMFTATWPQSVQALAASFMVDPVKITIGGDLAGRNADGGAVELQANARIAQKVGVVDPKDKEFRLLQILKEHQQGNHKNDRILVFCLYKKEATRIESMLSRKGIRVCGIHGDLRQEQRTRSLEAFKTGATPVLVATDVAARGLDIPEVKLVINVTLPAIRPFVASLFFEPSALNLACLQNQGTRLTLVVQFPLTIEDYVHRIGRTGRAGKTGEAITLFTIQDKAHSGSLVNILKGANQPVPEELVKFGTTVKKTHDMYGSFKDVDMNLKATKITFD